MRPLFHLNGIIIYYHQAFIIYVHSQLNGKTMRVKIIFAVAWHPMIYSIHKLGREIINSFKTSHRICSI